ncbi:MAG: hypothetical protein KIT69_13275 [Propionibacteriaceae bacterium]|nr:hypothetical protein [Propionibacteriaceae bacterium]
MGGAEGEASAAADAEGADAFAVNVGQGAEEVDAGAEVFGEDFRGADAAGVAAAFGVEGGVERERDEPVPGPTSAASSGSPVGTRQVRRGAWRVSVAPLARPAS